MRNDCNPLDRPSLLYIIIEELVFLKETRKTIAHITDLVSSRFSHLKARFKRFIKNDWTQTFIVLTGYMALSTVILLAAYELVLIF